MGASLIACMLEIENDKEPDWMAVRTWLEKKNADELGILYAKALDAIGLEIFDSKEVRENLLIILDDIQRGWEDEMDSTYSVLNLSRTRVLLVADRTWGDSPDGFDDMVVFTDSGMAKAAGFICGDEEPETPKPELEWTKGLCDHYFLGKANTKYMWVTVIRYDDMSQLNQHYPGCGFSPKTSWHETFEEAQVIGEEAYRTEKVQ